MNDFSTIAHDLDAPRAAFRPLPIKLPEARRGIEPSIETPRADAGMADFWRRLVAMSSRRTPHTARGSELSMTSGFASALSARQSTICVDVTDLLSYARHSSTLTGIQRVIVKVISTFIEMHGVEGVNLIYFDEKKRVFLRAGAEFFSGEYLYDQDLFCAYFKLKRRSPPTKPLNVREFVELRYSGRPVKRHFNYLRLRLANKLSNGRSFAKRNIVETKPSPLGAAKKVAWREACFNPSDRVLILGATWDVPDHAPTLAKYREAAEFTVYQMVHDLIPLITPEHVGEDVPPRIQKYLDEIFQSTDVILANSKATARDIERYAEARRAPFRPVIVVPLAHEFCLGAPEPAEKRPLRIFNDRNHRLPQYVTTRVSRAALDSYVLVVGTIESRKNVLRLIRVWTEIFRKNPLETPTLVFAGKPGFGSDEIFNALNAAGNLAGKIIILERPDDGEIGFLYANCLFSVYISYYEGWGLPVGESLWFGRPVLASSTSSLPEVGGDLVDYCNPYDDREIEKKLSRLIFDKAYRCARAEAIDQAALRTWRHVALDLWDALQGQPEAPSLDWTGITQQSRCSHGV